VTRSSGRPQVAAQGKVRSDVRAHGSGDRRLLTDEAVDVVTARMQVLGEPTRIRIMELLDRHEATVQEITDHLDRTAQATTHQNVSKHLRLLHQAGIVARRKEGNRVRYQLVDWTGYWLVRQISESVAARLDELRHALREPDDRSSRSPAAAAPRQATGATASRSACGSSSGE
jgi:DNA-binding transcriptional ArsR family regulator